MPLQIPHPTNALHLYRHILREATYLPPLARPWTYAQIKSRFRSCRQTDHVKRNLNVAHRQLRFLRAANAGHVDRMVRVCFLAAGRVGKRKRQLAGAYLSAPAPENSEALETVSNPPSDAMRRLQLAAWGKTPESGGKGGKGSLAATLAPSWMEAWDLPKVRRLAQSQYDHQVATYEWVIKNKMRRVIDPARSVITENCWGLPLKPRQMTHRLQKHWRSVLRALMPPLPRGEWDFLKSVVDGTAPESTYAVPKRRPVASLLAGSDSPHISTREESNWDWAKHATVPIRKLERLNSRRMMALSGSKPEQASFQGRPIGVRTLSPSYIRRGIYAKIWQTSPLMEKNAKGEWTVTWGTQAAPKPSVAAPSDRGFFQGVDSDGKVLR